VSEPRNPETGSPAPAVRIERTGPPRLAPLYFRSLVDRRPARLPDDAVVGRFEGCVHRFRIDADMLSRYQRICGFADSERLPVTFPHILAWGLHMEMLLQPQFSVRLPGLVHLWHRIEQRRALYADAEGEIECWLEGVQHTGRGAEFCLHTAIRVAGEICWEEETGFLARARRRREPRSQTPDEAPPELDRIADWEVAADMGRRYARASGDYNPIHLWPLTSRLFGFRRPIAHGMWSLARCAGALLEGAGERLSLEARFRRPLALPASVAFLADRGDAERVFRLQSADGGTIHLDGRLRYL
jgi:acyl dehydratase